MWNKCERKSTHREQRTKNRARERERENEWVSERERDEWVSDEMLTDEGCAVWVDICVFVCVKVSEKCTSKTLECWNAPEWIFLTIQVKKSSKCYCNTLS